MKARRWKFIRSNLWRNSLSGIYFARTSVNGRDTWKSLDTDVRAVAEAKLSRELARLRAVGSALRGGHLSLGELAAVYLERKRLHGHKKRGALKPRSLDYRTETVAQWRAAVEGFDEVKPALVDEPLVKRWADLARRKYGVTRFNGMVQSLRGMFDIGIEFGACLDNPARAIALQPVPLNRKAVPTREQFTEVLRQLDSHPRRKWSRLSVRAMAFTGLRPTEARALAIEDVDLKRGTVLARVTKNGKPRLIQLIPQARELFEDEGVATVLRALKKDPRKSLMTIGSGLGITLTPYTMRHLHMTALLESGVDVATAAAIAGHGDRGVTLLRTYVHVRPAHLTKQIKRIVI